MKKYHQKHYSEDFKLSVLIDYYTSGESKYFIIKKYGLTNDAIFYYWLKQYPLDKILLSLSQDEQELIMARQKKKQESPSRQEELEARIKDLEKALALANLRSHALNRMIDIAEETEGIKIRKKPGTKQ